MKEMIRIWVDKDFIRELKFIKKSLKLSESYKKNGKEKITNLHATKQVAKLLNSLRNIK